MDHIRLALAVVLIATGASGCTGSPPSPWGPDQSLGRMFAQCDERVGVSPATSPAVAATIDAFVPPAATVNCADAAAFTLDGAEVRLTFVSYGTLNDCPAGCFTSEVCAIHDATGVLLYSAAWYGDAERPLALPDGCATTDTRGCTPPPPGALHPLTQTAAFQAFRAAQLGGGAWRSCFF